MKPIDILTSGRHSTNIAAGLCTSCGKEAKTFRDAISAREYQISGLCQDCQDSVFNPGEEGEE